LDVDGSGETVPGLILSGVTGILPWPAPLAAAGFAIIMACAVVFHLSREERSSAIGMFILASFVVYMRWQTVSL
jgi:DoxX-like protein